MHSVLRSALARALSFVPIAVATLLTSRLIIHHFGIATFDSYALLLSLIFLIPLNNLGVGASITSAYAAEGPESDQSRRVTLTAARVLSVSTLGTVVVGLVLGGVGAWPTLLGPASGPSFAVGAAVAIYALTFVPGLGQNMLLGLNRNHVTVLIQAAFAPFILIGVVLVIVFGASGRWVIIVPSAATLGVSVMTLVVAGRVARVSWGRIIAAIPFWRHHPGARIRAMSVPVLIITAATPLALQSDRIVLSHVSTKQAVAQYSVMMQIIAPALALISASAQPLWPMFTKARATGRRGPQLGRMLLVFAAAALVLGAILAAVANPIAELIGGSQVHLGILLPVAGALTVVVTAISTPLSMSLMDPAGARFIAVTTVIALPVNIGLSILLGNLLDAPGPLLATALVAFPIQVVPGYLFSINRRYTPRHGTSSMQMDTLVEAMPVMIDVPTR